MPALSQSLADLIYSISGVLIVVGAITGLLGTVGNFWSGGIREIYSNERIAANEAETARAKEETQKAILEQQRLKSEMSWRRVSADQAAVLSLAMRDAPKEVWLSWVGEDPEATVYRNDLEAALKAAGVNAKYFSGYAVAVGLSIKGGTAEERELIKRAFTLAGIDISISDQAGFYGKNELEILVGTKPPPIFQAN